MTQMPVEQAAIQLQELLEQVANGEQVVIIRPDGSAFQLVALHEQRKPKFGSARGLIQIGDDFDEPLDDFAEYVP